MPLLAGHSSRLVSLSQLGTGIDIGREAGQHYVELLEQVLLLGPVGMSCGAYLNFCVNQTHRNRTEAQRVETCRSGYRESLSVRWLCQDSGDFVSC
ncbi:MAG: hypothetical protein J0H71_20095 [Rhizobiales bacterium]|nr:hypothetical protein [Hyphomicrobiales bacterium]